MPYKIYCVELDADAQGGTPIEIPDCVSQGLQNSPQLERIITAGETQPTHVSLIAQKALGSCDTYALKVALDAIGADPLSIVSAGENPGLLYYLQKFDEFGAIAAGSVHRSLLVSSGVIVPRRLTCDHQGHATLSFDVVIIKESANDAIVISDVADMPALIAATQGLRWTIGQTTVGGVSLTDYNNIEIDFGNTVETRGTQSDVWDAYVEVRTHAPTITLTGIDPAWFAAAAVPIDGLACTQANTVIYLRKRAQDGTGFVADNVAEHIKFTAAGVATVQQPMSGDALSFTDTSVLISCIEDASANNPIVMDTAIAIT